MAKNNKADMSCARVKKYTASDVSKAERHNERKNETYENMNVIVERIPFNVHFKKPTAPTYMEQLKQMETDGQVSLAGSSFPTCKRSWKPQRQRYKSCFPARQS